jgi:hypothetical protein
MTSSTVSAPPQQSESARILNSTRREKSICCASLDSSARPPVLLAHIHSVYAKPFSIAYAASQGVLLA